MKKTIILILLVYAFHVHAQNTDSSRTETQFIKLTISTPQPRLDEAFTLTLDVTPLRDGIFKSLDTNVKKTDDAFNYNGEKLSYKVTATSLGKNEIGTLQFVFDNTKYTSNKLVYEVLDPLPETNEGLLFRKVVTSDTTFCLIIEQHLPADDNKTTGDDLVKFKFNDIKGLGNPRSNTYSSTRQIKMNGKDKSYLYGYAIYYFQIEDWDGKVIFTKDYFENLPKGYKFEDIVVQ